MIEDDGTFVSSYGGRFVSCCRRRYSTKTGCIRSRKSSCRSKLWCNAARSTRCRSRSRKRPLMPLEMKWYSRSIARVSMVSRKASASTLGMSPTTSRRESSTGVGIRRSSLSGEEDMVERVCTINAFEWGGFPSEVFFLYCSEIEKIVNLYKQIVKSSVLLVPAGMN